MPTDITPTEPAARNFKYDVAFSFLAADEKLAREFAEALKPELVSFVYSEQQKELAGKDGVEEFSRVFKKDSRLNVILFRDGWGATHWTGVEEKAIKERVFFDRDGGWPSVLIIALEEKPNRPFWFPPSVLFFSLPAFGFKEAVGVIRVRALEAGAMSRFETPAELAARTRKRLEDRDRRAGLVNSGEGVRAAQKLIPALFAAIKAEADLIALETEGSQRVLTKADASSCVVCVGRMSLTWAWSTRYMTSLKDAELCVTLFDGHAKMSWDYGRASLAATQRRRCTYELFVAEGDEWQWREVGTSYTVSTAQLVKTWLNLLVRAAFAWGDEVKVLKPRQSP